jgi:cytochrome b pre-mRNA-processing protein 3
VISFSSRNLARNAAEAAYWRIVEQARLPVFFTDYGVPDTLDGRFELICLHAFLYLHRLKSERPRATRLCQSFFDRMFTDFDRSLREMGIGDLSIGKHVKRMAGAFYGRILAYEVGLAGDDWALGDALVRNVFGATSGATPGSAAMSAYVRSVVSGLRSQPAAELIAGRVFFALPPRLPANLLENPSRSS